MKTISLLTVAVLFFVSGAFGQKISVDLTFTAINSVAYVQLDSIKVMNRSQGEESTIYYPDTTLSLEITPDDNLLYIGYLTGYPVGVQEINQENSTFQLFQSYPNPVKDQSMISMYLPEDGPVSIWVNDIQGSVIVSKDQLLEKGTHYFRFSPGSSSFYILSARWKGLTESIKMINAGSGLGKNCMLDYAGRGDNDHSLKATFLKKDLVMLESGILDATAANETYTFQFATNIPCPGTPTVEYEGQVYNTIQIFSQCWLKENLNVGMMIPGTQGMSNNSVIEKYCYNNDVDSCTKYGGLYQWNEMMQYTIQQGARGICPSGWHLPTDEEWKVLEGAVDSQYGIGDSLWNYFTSRGYNAGTNLKTTSGWYENGNGTDLFGFSGLPGGIRSYGGFDIIGDYGYWWTSTEYNVDLSWHRGLGVYDPGVYRHYFNHEWVYGKEFGFSARCLRDN
jgi:uncharacterized protein (TIGR02145 family)